MVVTAGTHGPLDAHCEHLGWNRALRMHCVTIWAGTHTFWASPVVRAEVPINKTSVSTLGRCFLHSLLSRQVQEQFKMKRWGQFSPLSAFGSKTRLWLWQRNVSVTVALFQNMSVYGMNTRSSVYMCTCQRHGRVFTKVGFYCFSQAHKLWPLGCHDVTDSF